MVGYVHIKDNEIFVGDNADLNLCGEIVRINKDKLTYGLNGVNGIAGTTVENKGIRTGSIMSQSLEAGTGKIGSITSQNIQAKTIEMQEMLMETKSSSRFLHMTTEYYSVYDKALNSDEPLADENRKVYLGFEKRNTSYYPSLLMGINGVGAGGIVGTTYLNASHYPPVNNPRAYPNAYISYGGKVGSSDADRCSLDFMNGGESHLLSKGNFKCYINNAKEEVFGINGNEAYAKTFKSNSYTTFGSTCQFYVNGYTSGSDFNRILQYGLSQNFGNAPADYLATFMLGKNTIFYDGSELHIKDTSNYKNVKFNRANVKEVLAEKINSPKVQTETFTFEVNTQRKDGTNAKIVSFGDSENYSGAPGPGIPTLEGNGNQIYFGSSAIHVKKGSSYQEIWAKAIVPKATTTFNLNKLSREAIVEQDGFIGIDLEKVVAMQQNMIESLIKEVNILKEKVGA